MDPYKLTRYAIWNKESIKLNGEISFVSRKSHHGDFIDNQIIVTSVKD
jgi:hypothetical protein